MKLDTKILRRVSVRFMIGKRPSDPSDDYNQNGRTNESIQMSL